jgi:fibronectin type 3 domain-containing protein
MPSITLNWQAPTSGGAPASYNILRGTSAGGEATTPIASVSATSTTYTDTNVAPGGQYFYKVVAVNAEGSSDPSNEASAVAGTPPGVPQDLTAVGNS